MKAEDLNFSEKEVDEVLKKVILILLNVLSFYINFTKLKMEKRFKFSSKIKLILWMFGLYLN
jgi:hypothetical protein